MIPSKDRILNKKIKKREQNKLALLKKKGILKVNATAAAGGFEVVPIENVKDNSKNETSFKKKKKKTKKTNGVLPKNVPSVPQEESELEDEHSDEENLTKISNENDEGQENSSEEKEEQDDNSDDEVGNTELAPHTVELGKMMPGSSSGLEILNDSSFSALDGKVSSETLKAIEEMGFTKMTEVQAKAIPPLLDGRNLVGSAKTGSGKTLAFLIPAVELIVKLKFKPRNGTGCIIISPTRELAMQTYGVLQELMKYHRNTYGLVMGGAHRETEVKKLQNGISILVATPGRLVDHLQNTPHFMTKNLMCLIIDEADRILEIGFEEEMKQIINILPKKRQTMLFSATTTRKTEDLMALAIKTEPVYVGVHDKLDKATVDGLNQGYVVSPSEKRFLLLFTFLKRNRKKKVMVFFSTCMSVKFHEMLLNYIDLPVMSIHGKQEQNKRTTTFFKYCNAESGILLCTDVAARGLDIPAVDWIIQYDPPDDTKEYIHRVGRTARGEGGSGHAILFLRPEELGFLYYLQQAKVPLNEFDFNWSKVSDIQLQLEKLMARNYALNAAAKEGFKACVRSYDAHHLKKVFDVEKLGLTELAKNFGLLVPPRVDLKVNRIVNVTYVNTVHRVDFGKPLTYKETGNINSSQGSRPYKRKGGGGFGFNDNRHKKSYNITQPRSHSGRK